MRKLGFDGPEAGKRHAFMFRDEHRVPIPNPHGKDISVNLLKRILEQTEISKDEWETLINFLGGESMAGSKMKQTARKQSDGSYLVDEEAKKYITQPDPNYVPNENSPSITVEFLSDQGNTISASELGSEPNWEVKIPINVTASLRANRVFRPC